MASSCAVVDSRERPGRSAARGMLRRGASLARRRAGSTRCTCIRGMDTADEAPWRFAARIIAAHRARAAGNRRRTDESIRIGRRDPLRRVGRAAFPTSPPHAASVAVARSACSAAFLRALRQTRCRRGPPHRPRSRHPRPLPRRRLPPRRERSWLGPIAGLAAGLGIAALMSHLGLGAEFGNLVDAGAAGGRRDRRRSASLMRRFAAPRRAPARWQYAGRHAGADRPAAARRSGRRRLPAAADRQRVRRRRPRRARPPARRLRRRRLRAHRQDDLHPPAGGQRHRRPERPARLHDAGDVRVGQARPAGARRRGAAAPTWCRVDAEVLDFASEAERQVVSVRFHGLIRERRTAVADDVRRGLAPRQADRRQPRVGDRRIQQTTAA